MALDANKNSLFHQRARNIATALLGAETNITAERLFYLAQVQGSPAFLDTPIATTAEVTAMLGVLGDFLTFISGGAVLADAQRRNKLLVFAAGV